MEFYWNFQGGGGLLTKIPLVGKVWIIISWNYIGTQSHMIKYLPSKIKIWT